jgi:hypothetical protein
MVLRFSQRCDRGFWSVTPCQWVFGRWRFASTLWPHRRVTKSLMQILVIGYRRFENIALPRNVWSRFPFLAASCRRGRMEECGYNRLCWLIVCFTTLHQTTQTNVEVGKLSVMEWEKFWYEQSYLLLSFLPDIRLKELRTHATFTGTPFPGSS